MYDPSHPGYVEGYSDPMAGFSGSDDGYGPQPQGRAGYGDGGAPPPEIVAAFRSASPEDRYRMTAALAAAQARHRQLLDPRFVEGQAMLDRMQLAWLDPGTSARQRRQIEDKMREMVQGPVAAAARAGWAWGGGCPFGANPREHGRTWCIHGSTGARGARSVGAGGRVA